MGQRVAAETQVARSPGVVMLNLDPMHVLLVVLLALVLLLVVAVARWRLKGRSGGPWALPVIGHLHLLAGYKVPYEAFTHLGRRYGDLLRLRLGSVESLVVNGQKNIRDILVTKGHYFDSRPNFQRYQELFCGDKDNSLAFCDWSDKQKTRRDMLRAHTFPRAFTRKFESLERIISEKSAELINKITADTPIAIKPLILRTCANIFTNHFCSKNFEHDDKDFIEMVDNFDEVFYEINQGYAADFLPFLLPLHKFRFKTMTNFAHKIRDFMTEFIISDRFDNTTFEPQDYVDSLIKHVKDDNEPSLNWNSALFALEDIVGGHSAVGNFVVKLLAYLVQEPEVQKKVQEEIDEITCEGGRNVTISDRNSMPYTEAVLFEAIRLIASPIVPRVANQDTTVNGHEIKAGTLIFLNNHDLSMSNELWYEPEKFMPERFLKGNKLHKPDHFLPFGGGRRSCMGYKMVQLASFGIISDILQQYDILPVDRVNYEVPVGSLALPKDTFSFKFSRRKRK